jgi:hypothetical protein
MAKTEEGLNLLESVYTKFLVKYYASNHSPLPIRWFLSDKRHYLGAEKGFGIIESFYDNGQSFKNLTQYLEETGLKCYLYTIVYPININGSMNICLDIYPEYETEEKIENIKTLMALLFK